MEEDRIPSPRTGGSADALDQGTLERYRLTLMAQAARHKRYPPRAMDNGWSGRVEIRLEIGGSSALERLAIKSSSGYSVLDEQALDMVKRARALAPLPPALRGRELTIDIPVIFDLRSG